MEREVSAVPAPQDLTRAARQQRQDSEDLHPGQSREGRKPGENRPHGPGPIAVAAEVIREAKGHGMDRGKLANGRLPGRVRTGVPTQARVQHAGTDRDPEARGRVPAIEGQDGKSKDAIFFYREGAKSAKEGKRFSPVKKKH